MFLKLLLRLLLNLLKLNSVSVFSDIGSVVTGVLGVGSNVLGAKQNSENVEDTNRTNLQIARENNQFNQQMWEENNAYNDPSAQKERLLAAGFNP